jgi:hypothetical protein
MEVVERDGEYVFQHTKPPIEELVVDEVEEPIETITLMTDGDLVVNTINVFETVTQVPEQEDEWDYEAEQSSRTPHEPYIIHSDEFHSGESGLRQTTLTYYAGDDVLCDEAETPIYNAGEVVGELRFGHGSKDANVVYVRNEKLGGEYEIVRDEGHFAIEVLGQSFDDVDEPHIQHKMRQER